MNYSCCNLDSICHMDTSGYYSLMEKIVNSSTETTQNGLCIFITFLVLLFVLLGIILCLFCNMNNKYREERSLIISEISNINQSLKSSINSSIRNVFDDFVNQNNKNKDCKSTYNESQIKLYFLLNDILDNIDACFNYLNNSKTTDGFIDEFFKFQSNHIKIINSPHSASFAHYTNIDELLCQFEKIAKEVLRDSNNPNKQEYNDKIDEIKKKLNHYIMMLKELLNF